MPTFTSNWTDNRLDSWLPFLEELKGEPLLALEIGTFEGRTALWFLENILTGSEDFLQCVDPYDYMRRQELKRVERARQKAVSNLKPHAGRYKLFVDYSYNVLPGLESGAYDFVYVDGDHSAASCFYDMGHAWRLLKPGGVMIVDDIQETRPENWGRNCPLEACKLFLELMGLTTEKLWHDAYTMGIMKP